jgi:antitoxin (DNA-binding transcriptional repressor) of toxin-antitoxin stability system
MTQSEFAKALHRVTRGNERVRITRRGTPIAARIDMVDHGIILISNSRRRRSLET